MLETSYLVEHIEAALFFGVIGCIFNWIAVHKKFYHLPFSLPFTQIKISLPHVLVAFALYLFPSFFLAPYLIHLASSHFSSLFSAGIQMACLTSFLSLLFLLAFCYLPFLRKSTHPRLWWSSVPFPERMKEVGFALITWMLAMPLVGFIEQTFDLILYILFGVEHYDQVAVLYLKKAAHSLQDLLAALFLILWVAPIAEETLFRGFLQSWFKKHLGSKAAILLASLCFALFHFSPSHGAGNLSLIPTLFTFSCFLGFVYEKRNSLLASTFLHGFFNFINAVRILLFDST